MNLLWQPFLSIYFVAHNASSYHYRVMFNTFANVYTRYGKLIKADDRMLKTNVNERFYILSCTLLN